MATIPFSISRAYLISVAKYQYSSWQLKTPHQDTHALQTILQDQGFEVTRLMDPTAAQLSALFSQIQQENTEKSGRLLIYYAGHGLQRDSAYGLKGYFVPADAHPGDEHSMIPMELLSETLRQVSSRHILLILDCCFAGTFRMQDNRRSIGFRAHDQPLFRQHYEMFTRFPSKLLLTSTSYRQKAFDRIEDGEANSPFNRYLCKAIEGAADYTLDRLVTAGELKTYLSDSVSKITEYAGNLQSVGLDALDGDGEGEFLFFLDSFNASHLQEQAYVNPYKGLQSYNVDDAGLFFGRNKAIQALLSKANDHHFVMVTGASGTGKSSLVKAGLLPALQRKGLQPERIAIVRPGKNPLSVLPSEQKWDLLIVDQWEEVITQAQDPQEVEAFYEAICELLENGKRIIGTVRADFEAQVRQEKLESYWNTGRFLVPPFTPEEYRDVIVQPAKRVACLFEDRELVQQIEQEVAHQPGPLPLLSFMLSELFERAKGDSLHYREIKRKHYNHVGGVSGALRNKAEEVFAALPDEGHQDTMRHIMLRMVALSAGEMAGRRVFLEDLDFGIDQKPLVKHVVEVLTNARLIRNTTPRTEQDKRGESRDVDAAGREDQRPYIEPAHDALVRAWKRLWEWVRDLSEENLLLHSKLGGDVNEYKAKQSGKKFLWHENPRLDQAVALIKTDPLLLNQAEREFVEASVVEKRRLRRLFVSAGVFIVVIIFTTAVIAWVQRGYAQESQKEAEKRLRDFEVADSIRLVEARGKEKLNFDKYILDGDQFSKSGDHDLALRKYQNADSLLRLYLGKSPDAATLGDSLRKKIQTSTLLNSKR